MLIEMLTDAITDTGKVWIEESTRLHSRRRPYCKQINPINYITRYAPIDLAWLTDMPNWDTMQDVIGVITLLNYKLGINRCP